MSPKTRFLEQISWLEPFFYTILLCLLVTGLSRLGHVLWLSDRVSLTTGVGFILAQGVRFELVTLGYLLAIPAAATPFFNSSSRLASMWFTVLRLYFLVLFTAFAFMEVVTPPFISEYDIRPNYLFVEYLKYPKEVLSMLFTGYKVEILAAIILVPALVWPFQAGLRRRISAVRRNRILLSLPMAFAALLLCVAAARSTLDHRPVNPSTVAYSSDTLMNSLPLNSLYSTAYAIYATRHEENGFPYGEVPEADAVEAIRSEMYVSHEAFFDVNVPTLRQFTSTHEYNRPKNLVIIIEESLGAEFVGALGGLPLTPNLDEFAEEGIWFENLFATGTRSARGLEAILTGFPPTTSQSVLKLARAQEDFFTIGEFLRRKGFDTSFIYGGEAQFDNMRRFFASNGFSQVIDKHDFVNPVFYGSWGASDEDVFSYAHERFLAQDVDKPFFGVLFTTSNHSPWDYPDDRIELYEEPKATVNNAVKYADHALGQYLRRAQTSPYWDNTVFLVVSDHNSRVYGSELVPIERFHIPGLILGGGIEPQRWSRIVSQIDLLPTLLSMLGVSGAHPAPGIDLTRSDIDSIPGRAVMQFGDIQAYMHEDRVVVLRKDRAPQMFTYEDQQLADSEPDAAMEYRASALAAWPSIAYRNQNYRLPSRDGIGNTLAVAR